jgi:hypothetical protein
LRTAHYSKQLIECCSLSIQTCQSASHHLNNPTAQPTTPSHPNLSIHIAEILLHSIYESTSLRRVQSVVESPAAALPGLSAEHTDHSPLICCLTASTRHTQPSSRAACPPRLRCEYPGSLYVLWHCPFSARLAIGCLSTSHAPIANTPDHIYHYQHTIILQHHCFFAPLDLVFDCYQSTTCTTPLRYPVDFRSHSR